MVGYGDVYMVTTVERFYAIFAMLLGAVVFAAFQLAAETDAGRRLLGRGAPAGPAKPVELAVEMNPVGRI